jgi:hypothetical protein
MLKSALAIACGALLLAATAAEAARNPPGPIGGPGRGNPPGPIGGPGRGNPPGPVGGPGTNWWLGNPPGPVGGRGAGPRWQHRVIPAAWVYWGLHGGVHWYKHNDGYWCLFDNDGNPPGPRGGAGTNWENPPGPVGGPGGTPDGVNRPC